MRRALVAVFTGVADLRSVALDFVVLVAVAVLLKERLDRARFRLGDLKHGLRGI